MLKIKTSNVFINFFSRVVYGYLISLFFVIVMSFKTSIAIAGNSGKLFTHEAFSIMIPTGWNVIKNPEPRIEIGFEEKEASPKARWYLHYEVMPKAAGEPPSDPTELRTISNMFDNLIRQQYPDARQLTTGEWTFPGKTVFHLFYQLNDRGTIILQRYVYIFAYGTAYTIKCSVPKAREEELKSAVHLLFRSFQPRPGTKKIYQTPQQVLKGLQEDFPKLAATMPIEWKPVIEDVKFLMDTPKNGETTLLLETSWNKENLQEVFYATKSMFNAVQQGKTKLPKTSFIAKVTLAETANLMKNVGKLLGLPLSKILDLKPPVTQMQVSLADRRSKHIGLIRIAVKDFVKVMSSENIDPKEAANLYYFE